MESRRKIVLPSLSIRKREWSNCVVEINDIGRWTFWGQLVDIKTGQVINSHFIGRINGDWEPVFEAKEFIRKLRVKKNSRIA